MQQFHDVGSAGQVIQVDSGFTAELECGLVLSTGQSSEAAIEVVELVMTDECGEVDSHSSLRVVVVPRINYRRGGMPERAEPAVLEANTIETSTVDV